MKYERTLINFLWHIKMWDAWMTAEGFFFCGDCYVSILKELEFENNAKSDLYCERQLDLIDPLNDGLIVIFMPAWKRYFCKLLLEQFLILFLSKAGKDTAVGGLLLDIYIANR